MTRGENQAMLVSENNGIDYRVVASIDHWMANVVFLFRRPVEPSGRFRCTILANVDSVFDLISKHTLISGHPAFFKFIIIFCNINNYFK